MLAKFLRMRVRMDSKNYMLLILLPLIAMPCFVPVVQSSNSWETDKTAVVSRVIDGDTFDTSSGDRIRLADIDAPEQGESGYKRATDFLTSLVYNKQVYLDIDDISRTDQYGRLVCVVYVDYNSTHLKNVNKALLVEGVTVIWDFNNNEFNPYSWTLYVPKTETPKFPNLVILAIILPIVALVVIILYKRKLEK